MIRWKSIYYSFPVQLLILQFRNHFLFVLIWLILLGSVMGYIGSNFGVHYVFVAPEYIGHVSYLSFFIVGLSYGAFLFSWNLSTYLLSAYRFPFLATLRRPFLKFCVNNLIIPLFFLVVYLIRVVKFFYGEIPTGKIVLYCLSFVGGLVVFVGALIVYFVSTNKDIFSFLKARREAPDMSTPPAPGQRMNKSELYRITKRSWRVDTFLTEKLRWRVVRGIGHYDVKILLRVFRQNHINVLLVQLAYIVFLMFLGFKMENKYFRIPTGASLFILSSVFIGMIGAIGFWFKRWTALVWVLIFLFLNNITKYDFFNLDCRAFGLEYKGKRVPYNNERLGQMMTDSIRDVDQREAIAILEKWRARFPADRKPKLILVSASGGGLKASLWTMKVLQEMDKATEGDFFRHTVLITGASGGMLGASYYRELKLRQLTGQDINPYGKEYLDNISKDLLNSIYSTIVTNDIFIPIFTARRQGKEYRRDRGYMFELQFNENTDSLLEKPISAYREPERNALIPRILLTPSIINDGRKLIISPLNNSYLMAINVSQYKKSNINLDAVDFRRLLDSKKADQLSFVSALRMNATYPIVLPSVSLPTSPEIEVVDAGFRDNLGKTTAIRFATHMADWIEENTSGVIFVQIAGWQKFAENQTNSESGWIASLFKPLGIFNYLSEMQDFDSDVNFGLLAKLVGDDKLDLVRFEYVPTERHKRASMSFHLTNREKRDILNSIEKPVNKKAKAKLLKLLGH